ncbi:MAG: hypothetical protein QM679_06795 [Patulibacter sp.]
MAGRRWAEGKSHGGSPSRTLRPSERRAAGQPKVGEGKRRQGSAPLRATPSPEAVARARARLKPPPAPWHPLPLAELAIVFGAAGMLISAAISSDHGLAASFLLVVLGTGEFAWREHRHGYRSHGALLAALVVLPVVLAAWRFAHLATHTALVVFAILFVVAWSAFTSSYRGARERFVAQDAAAPHAAEQGDAGDAEAGRPH